jgi:protein-L-isoaspartate(D-aspartate) O-methyltransferase
MAPYFLKIMVVFVTSPLIFNTGGCTRDQSSAGERDQHNMASADFNFDVLRGAMVRDQLQQRDVKDAQVLAAMRRVPRHEFVPESIVASAYDDCALPLSLGQTISQPYIVGFMTQALKLTGKEKVLEIGTGSGYQAAVLAEIVPEVYTMEILPDLAERARTVLTRLGYKNIYIRTGDGYQGWPESAPFDRIIVTAAPDQVPQPLIDQLKTGGRMVIPVGRFDQQLVVLEKTNSGITRLTTIPVRFVPMTGKAQEPVRR